MLLANGLKSLRYTASLLIGFQRVIEEQLTHVTRQRRYLKYECLRKFRAGYTHTVHVTLVTEFENVIFQKLLFVEIIVHRICIFFHQHSLKIIFKIGTCPDSVLLYTCLYLLIFIDFLISRCSHIFNKGIYLYILLNN